MRKIISIVLSFGLLFQQSGLLYAAGEINLANYLSSMHSAITQPDRFQPARLRYISYDMANNDFKLLLDKGNAKLNDATPELFNYFLIGLALPNDTFWVNLRPDAADNIIDPILEKTDIGKIFLEADLQLKKDTASLTSPQNPEGKSYWDKLYKKVGELFGTENITIPTITRPWIVPNEVIVRETEDSAYIYKATLKVMLEADYLIGRGGSRTAPTPDQYSFSDPRLKELNEYSSQIIRETIIPRLTKEINSSKRYAKLRQVYYSLVLSRWFKQKYSSLGSTRAPEHPSTTLGASQSRSPSVNSYLSLIDSGNLANLASKESYDKQTYFQAYQKSFKDGEYNLKETVATPFGQSVRSYISGGISVVGSPIMPGNFKAQAENTKVTKALTRVSASPLELKHLTDALKEIQRGLKNMNKIVSDLSKKGYAYDILLQDISNPLGQVMSGLQKKIDYLGQPQKEGILIEYTFLSDSGKLKDDLGKIQSAINKFAEKELSEDEKAGGIKSKFNDLSAGIENVFASVKKLDKKLQTSAGSPVLGEELVVFGKEGEYLPGFRYVAYNELDEEQQKWISEQLWGVFSSKIVLENGEWDLKDRLSVNDPYYIQEISETNLGMMIFAVKVKNTERGDVLESLEAVMWDRGEKSEVYGKYAIAVSDVPVALINALDKENLPEGVSSAVEKQVGGIDLTDRALHIKLERVGSFAATPLLLPQVKNAQDLDLDKEFEQIEALASSGIVPNSRRLLELFTACHYRGEFGERLTQIISCLKASSAIQEVEAIDSDEDFRLALILPEMLS